MSATVKKPSGWRRKWNRLQALAASAEEEEADRDVAALADAAVALRPEPVALPPEPVALPPESRAPEPAARDLADRFPLYPHLTGGRA